MISFCSLGAASAVPLASRTVSSAIKPGEVERQRMTKQHRKRMRASQEIPGKATLI
jgi:hypothetical protein